MVQENRVFVGFAVDSTAVEVVAYMRTIGPLVGSFVPRDVNGVPRTFVFVEYQYNEDAEKAVALDHSGFGSFLRVTKAEKR